MGSIPCPAPGWQQAGQSLGALESCALMGNGALWSQVWWMCWCEALGPQVARCEIWGENNVPKQKAGSRISLGSSSVCWHRGGKNVPFDSDCTLWVLAVLRKGNAWGRAVVGK